MPNKENQTIEQIGLVVSYFGNSVAVETDTGQVFQCHLRRNQELPVVGDKVRWQREGDQTGIIVAIEPRKSLVARGDSRKSSGKMKPIAANIDAIVIVMAPAPVFSEYLIDRYLIAAELLSIPSILVLNKIDLLDEDTRTTAFARLQTYKNIPYPVVTSSIYLAEGLKELSLLLKSQTAILVGPSGVGKSSIISALAGGEVIRVGEVSAKGAGKHTTTATRLYHLPQGGALIDSPGVREFTLWAVDGQDILKGFKEFSPFIGRCKFRDCRHLIEPGCAVQAAVADGTISAQRYQSYQEFMKSVGK